MEPRPLSDEAFAASEPQESRLELVPALDDPEEETEDAPAEAAEDEDDGSAAEELEALESAVQAQDPLKLYVRSIGAALLESGSDAFETLEHAGQLAKVAKQWRNTAVVQPEPSMQEAAIQLSSWPGTIGRRANPARGR